VNRSRDGEFTRFVELHGTRLLRFAALLTGDPAAAEDLLQSVLEKTYRRWSKVGVADSPDAYVHQALVNSARRQWRLRALRRETPAGLAPDERVEGGQRAVVARESLMQAMNVLTRQQRAVIVLRYFADQSEAEVARLLGCSVGTVKAHASRGLQRLRGDRELAQAALDLVQE
jgi:RNA polymerase sigma-70 factor (sigma-E family)